MMYNTNPIDPSKELLGMKELLAWLLIESESTIYDWLNKESPRFKSDLMPPFRIGRCIRWYKEDICRFIESCAATPSIIEHIDRVEE